MNWDKNKIHFSTCDYFFIHFLYTCIFIITARTLAITDTRHIWHRCNTLSDGDVPALQLIPQRHQCWVSAGPAS